MVGGFAEVGLDAQPACGEEVAHARLGGAEERRGGVLACVGRGVGQGAGLAVEQEELGEVGGQLQARQLLGAQGDDGRVQALHLGPEAEPGQPREGGEAPVGEVAAEHLVGHLFRIQPGEPAVQPGALRARRLPLLGREGHGVG